MRLLWPLLLLAACAMAASAANGPVRPAPSGRIVFASAGGGPSAIWSVGPTGAGLRRLTTPDPSPRRCYCRGGDFDGHPALSQDGRRIAFTRGASLLLLDADGGAALRVTAPPGAEDFGPAWSSRGRLAFVRAQPGHGSGGVYEIVSVDQDGRSPLVLAGPQRFPFGDLAWSPDGRSLAYKAPYADPVDGIKVGLHVVPEGGGHPRFLLWAVSLAEPSWSPDGRTIAFAANEPGAPPLGPYRLFTIGLTGRRIVQLTHPFGDSVSDIGPRWSPDGRTIVFTRFRLDRPSVLAIRPDGRRATVLAVDAQLPAWSPDGSRIIYVAHVADHRLPLALTVMRRDGSGSSRLVALHRPQDGFDLSPQSWSRR